jgi:hypothetical protein
MVTHRRPGRKDIRFGSAISLPPPPRLYAILIWAAGFTFFQTERWNLTDS